MGALLNGKTYAVIEYIEAVLITAGVSLFSLSERSSPSHLSNQTDSTFGICLLALYLASDSFTSQWQSRVFRTRKVDQYQVMLGTNIWAMLMTGITLYYSGEFFTSFAYLLSDSSAMFHMTILSITSATGQLFIFYTIKEFGPVVFTIMMTVRQLISLFTSLLLFGHVIGLLGWISTLGVFAVVINRIRRGQSD